MSYPALSPCGTRARYVGGCRCEPCTEANRAYHRDHRYPTGTRDSWPRFHIGVLPPMDWAADAICTGLDPDIFHPLKGQSADTAEAICRTCPVRIECLEWAVETRQRCGIWGGLSADERAEYRYHQTAGASR